MQTVDYHHALLEEVRDLPTEAFPNLLQIIHLYKKSVRTSRSDGRHWPADQPSKPPLVYPTRLVPAAQLDNLTGLVPVGGDALADSEALYDPDWN